MIKPDQNLGKFFSKEDQSIEKETDLKQLQDFAVLYHEKNMPEDQEKKFISLAQKYIDENHDGTYYNEGNTDYIYVQLPNGLYLEADAHLRSNTFYFSGVLSKEDAEKRIDMLAKQREEDIKAALDKE